MLYPPDGSTVWCFLLALAISLYITLRCPNSICKLPRLSPHFFQLNGLIVFRCLSKHINNVENTKNYQRRWIDTRIVLGYYRVIDVISTGNYIRLCGCRYPRSLWPSLEHYRRRIDVSRWKSLRRALFANWRRHGVIRECIVELHVVTRFPFKLSLEDVIKSHKHITCGFILRNNTCTYAGCVQCGR